MSLYHISFKSLLISFLIIKIVNNYAEHIKNTECKEEIKACIILLLRYMVHYMFFSN